MVVEDFINNPLGIPHKIFVYDGYKVVKENLTQPTEKNELEAM
jgi:hypothetical protein